MSKRSRPKVTAEPNYENTCDVCGQTPTVVLVTHETGKAVKADMDMCGVCTWGTAECLDPDNW